MCPRTPDHYQLLVRHLDILHGELEADVAASRWQARVAVLRPYRRNDAELSNYRVNGSNGLDQLTRYGPSMNISPGLRPASWSRNSKSETCSSLVKRVGGEGGI